MKEKLLIFGLGFLMLFVVACPDNSSVFQMIGGFGFEIGEPPSDETNPEHPNAPTTTTDPTIPPGETPVAICDPLEGGSPVSVDHGVLATLTYLSDFAGRAYDLKLDYFRPGMVDAIPNMGPVIQVLNKVYVNSISKKTSWFDTGFRDSSNNLLKDKEGNALIEYFALFTKAEITLAAGDPEGDYQFAIVSDDGAIMKVDRDGDGKNFETWVNNDGTHANRVACASSNINFKSGQKLPMELGWYQGPKTEIAFMLFWRTGSYLNVTETLCGKMLGNEELFDHLDDNQQPIPPEPTAVYNAFVARGWKMLTPSNYLLPNGLKNPC